MIRMYNPPHPGEVLLEDYIKPLGISVRALSISLHVPYRRMRETVSGKRAVSVDMALRLERYFGSDARGWLAMQSTYDLRRAEGEIGVQIKQEISPRLVDTQALKGIFQKPDHPVSIESMNNAIASRGAQAMMTGMFNPPTPGMVLLEYMMDSSVDQTAAKLGVESDVLTSLIDGDCPISADVAIRLGRLFGTSAELWIGLQAQYDRAGK